MNMICICCPVGCHLTVEEKANDINVSGNKCAKGKTYGIEEILAPKRMVTAVVKTTSDAIPYVPVKTASVIPKEKIKELLEILYEITVKVPVKVGQVVLEDFDGTGVNVVATRTIDK